MNEPIAYAAVAADGSESVYVASLKEQAEACCRENGWQLVPLYAAVHQSWQLVHENERLRDEIARLRLTDAEREAVEVCAQAAANCGGFGGDHARPAIYKGDEVAATLRGLLERLGGVHDS